MDFKVLFLVVTCVAVIMPGDVSSRNVILSEEDCPGRSGSISEIYFYFVSFHIDLRVLSIVDLLVKITTI